MKRYPKIRRIGHPDADGVLADGELVILEKVDGNNFRFRLTESGKLRFGSRRTKLGTDPDGIGGQFDDVTDYLAETVDRAALSRLEREHGPLVFFGENAVEHTLEYDWERLPQFLGFDVWLADEEAFAPYDLAVELIEAVGLEPAPLVERTTAAAFRESHVPADGDRSDVDYEIPESQYRDGPAEGVVVRNVATGRRAKIVAEAFRERRESTDDGPTTDTERLVETYCTDARIRKAIFRLVDEGEWDAVEMPMMRDLPMAVIEDVFREEAREIALNDWEIDTRELRKRVGRRCQGVVEATTLDDR